MDHGCIGEVSGWEGRPALALGVATGFAGDLLGQRLPVGAERGRVDGRAREDAPGKLRGVDHGRDDMPGRAERTVEIVALELGRR